MSTTKDWPTWLERALQGLTYWTGHRRCLYRNYPLAEAAFVAELCNLIQANLPDRYSLDVTRVRRHISASSLKLLERHRAQLVKMTVPADSIVETFDVIKYI